MDIVEIIDYVFGICLFVQETRASPGPSLPRVLMTAILLTFDRLATSEAPEPSGESTTCDQMSAMRQTAVNNPSPNRGWIFNSSRSVNDAQSSFLPELGKILDDLDPGELTTRGQSRDRS